LDKDCEPFYWHIASHSAFHAVLYVLSELRSPGFQHENLAQSKDRGLEAVIRLRNIRGIDGDKLWNVITRLISKFTGSTETPRLDIDIAVGSEQSRPGSPIRPHTEYMFRGARVDRNASYSYMPDVPSIHGAVDSLPIGDAGVGNDAANLDLVSVISDCLFGQRR